MFSQQVDQIIINAPDFAQPILEHLRSIVHTYCPEAEEKIKWQFPCFDYKGKILCNMAAFKNHCTFGFWQAKLLSDPHQLLQLSEGISLLGGFGKITHISQLPSKEIIGAYIIEAMILIEQGVKNTSKITNAPIVQIPEYILEALQHSQLARLNFESLSESCKKEYVNWIIQAKREETKSKRIETMIELLEKGKSLMWKYQKKSSID